MLTEKRREADGQGEPKPSRWERTEAPVRSLRLGRWGWFGCVLVAFALVQCSRGVDVGQEVPDFSLKDLKGGAVSLGDLRGKVVFLHFWATWCPPCLVELPGLVRFVNTLDNREIVLLAVCVDNERPAKIRDFLRSWGEEVPVYLDPGGSLAKRLGTFRFPETYILDHEGRVCRKVIGAGEWKISKWAHILHACARGPITDKRGMDTGS